MMASAAAALLIVLGAAGPAMASESVSIVDFSFNPSSLTISAGTTVVWTNNGQQPHSATANDGSFDSSPGCPNNVNECIQPGESYSHTFSSAGSFPYHCKVHPTMTGTIQVEGTASSPGPTSPGQTSGSPLPNTGAGSLTGPFVIFGFLFLLAGGFVLYRLRRRAGA